MLRLAGIEALHPAPLHPYLTGVMRVGAEDRARHLRPAGPYYPGDPDHLAGAHLEGDIVKYALAREFLDVEQDLPDPGPPAGKLVLDGAPHHHPDEFLVVGCGRHLADHLPVPQDGHPVSDLGNLFEVMRDEDHADLFLLETANYLEKALDFLARERGGRLVHYQDPGGQTQRLGYLDHLPLRDAQSRDRSIRVHAHLYPLQEPLRLVSHLAAIHDPEPSGLASEEDVLGHG